MYIDSPPTGTGQLKKWGLLFSSLPKLIQLRHQYDLIFVSGYRIIGLTAVLAGKLFHKPVVLKADSQGEMSGDFFESGLKKIGISLNRAKHFIVANKNFERVERQPWQIKDLILAESKSKYFKNFSSQINLF